MSSEITSAGSVSVSPPRPEGVGELSSVLSLAFAAIYAQVDSGSFSFLGTNLAPYVMNPGGVTKVRLLAVRAIDGQTLQALLTSSLGTDQVVPFSGLLLVHCPAAGTELTAVKLLGSGRIEYLVAGDGP